MYDYRQPSASFIVIDALYDEFLQTFTVAMAAAVPADPMTRGAVLGPLSSVIATARLSSQLDRAVTIGARLNGAEAPFVGVKQSGSGCALGTLGVREFVNNKVIRTG